MSAAEHSVLPTSVLAPKTMAVRRAAIFLAFLHRYRLWCRATRPLQGGGLCRRFWAAGLQILTATATYAAMLYEHVVLCRLAPLHCFFFDTLGTC